MHKYFLTSSTSSPVTVQKRDAITTHKRGELYTCIIINIILLECFPYSSLGQKRKHMECDSIADELSAIN